MTLPTNVFSQAYADGLVAESTQREHAYQCGNRDAIGAICPSWQHRPTESSYTAGYLDGAWVTWAIHADTTTQAYILIYGQANPLCP